MRALKPVQFTEQGQIRRIRGIAYATRVSSQMANRVMESARSVLTRYIPDVYIYTDVYKGPESGKSPGYALTLVAESNTDGVLSAECAFQPRAGASQPLGETAGPTAGLAPIDMKTGQPLKNESGKGYEGVSEALLNDYHFPTPEDLGVRTARLLLQEIKKGGCVDTVCQWIYVLFITLGPEDVGKVRIGNLSPFTYASIKVSQNSHFVASNSCVTFAPSSQSHSRLRQILKPRRSSCLA